MTLANPVIANWIEWNKTIAQAQREQVLVKHSKLVGDIKPLVMLDLLILGICILVVEK